MKTFLHLWKHIFEFSLEWECFRQNLQRISKHTFSITYFWNSIRLWDNVEKCGWAREAADNDTIRRMRFECWVIKVAYVRSVCVVLNAFPREKDCTNASQCYVMRTLHVLFLPPTDQFNTRLGHLLSPVPIHARTIWTCYLPFLIALFLLLLFSLWLLCFSLGIFWMFLQLVSVSVLNSICFL